MEKIYIADDEDDIRNLVENFLKNDGYLVSSFPTGDELYAAFCKEACDLVILDIMMPGSDGITILTELRKLSKVPVILLTAKDSDSDYYNGITLGSDDYITKPFKPMLLLAKVKAILRRVSLENEIMDASSVPVDSRELDITCGNLEFNEKEHAFKISGKEIALTPTEAKFLIFMMHRFDEAVKKSVILDEIWGMDETFETRVADETNRRLRKKLLEAGSDVYIQTVWGYGFKLTYKEP